MRLRRTVALVIGIGTVTALVTVPAADATPPATQPAAPAATGAVGTVTLITGDKVTFRKQGKGIQVLGSRSAAQRPNTAFIRLTEHGDQYVIPSDSWHAIADGQLDKGLFDITSLVTQRLDDQHTDHVGVIVTGPRGFAPNVAVPRTAKVTRTMADIGARAMSTAKSDATALWTSLTREKGGHVTVAAGTRIWLDGVAHATLDQSVPLIGAPTAWQHGYTGRGVTVAVLDTGIDADHPDLVGKVVTSQNFTDSPDVDDHFGHGTHVASTITGSGAASGGRYKGVAPDVRLISGKVLGDNGSGSESDILAGMDWAVHQGAKVINMSLGGGPSDGTDVLSAEVNALSASSGALFVVAAGNFGGAQTVSTPAAADAALAVASTTKQDTLSLFSSRGPRPGNFGLKPEIAAPGQDIVAARAPGTLTQEAVDANYANLSGTSMATPHVAGAAAIVAGEHPDWTGQQIKAALMDSARVLPGIDVFGDGAGRVDVARATAQRVHTLTPEVSLGQLATPAQPTTAAVTYANDSAAPVVLTLAMSANGLFGTTAGTLTVPAHGTASTTLSVAAGPAGSYDGRLVATAPGVRLVTPVAAQVVAKPVAATVHVLDRTGGQVTSDNILAALQNDTTGDVYPVDTDGTAAVPAGTYRVVGGVFAPSETFAPTEFTAFVLDKQVIDGPTALTVDARQARRATVSVAEPTARPDEYSNYHTIVSQVNGTGIAVQSNYPGEYILEPAAVPGVSYTYDGAWGRPQDVLTMSGLELDHAIDNSAAGWRFDVTGQLVDIGEPTDASAIGDVAGKVVLISPDVRTVPTADPPGQDQFTALLTALKAKGAKLVISYDFIENQTVLPMVQLFNPNDIQALRGRLAAGVDQLHAIGQPYSPYVYALHNTLTGALPNGQAWHFDRSTLATVDATFRKPSPGAHFNDQFFGYSDPDTGTSGSFDRPYVQPQDLVEYFTPGVAWSEFTGDDLDANSSFSEQTIFTTYQAGQHTTSRWGSAPFGPRLPLVPYTNLDGKLLPWVYRQGDKLYSAIPMFNDADVSHVDSPDSGAVVDTGSTTLYRDGTVVDTSDVPGVAGFTLSRRSGAYRLVVDGTRATTLSPHVHAEWTFASGHTDPAVRTASSLLDVGFTLPLDGFESAVAGAPLSGTLMVSTQQGATAVHVNQVTVDVSYDDGKTWRPAAVHPAGRGRWSLTVPGGGAAGGFATLRASVGGAGGSVTETITRAYALK